MLVEIVMLCLEEYCFGTTIFLYCFVLAMHILLNCQTIELSARLPTFHLAKCCQMILYLKVFLYTGTVWYKFDVNITWDGKDLENRFILKISLKRIKRFHMVQANTEWETNISSPSHSSKTKRS